MVENISPKVKEAWTGPGRKDGVISTFTPKDDALHMDKKGMYEWWYFDAHLEGGYTVVAFFHASNPNPGTAGRIGVEMTLLRPDGRKTAFFVEYDKSDFEASTETPDVRIGENYMKSDFSNPSLPVYEIHLEEGEIGFDLTYTSTVHGWIPGDGYSEFEGMGYFAWVVPFPRATVSGTIHDGNETMAVKGIGYHDHNWLNFPFQRYIEYWMWGRVYSENYTVDYAYIQLNKKMDNHAVKVLMLAEGEDIILSTGEFDFVKEDLVYDERAKHKYPESLVIRAPGEVEVSMKVRRVLEAEDMLQNFGAVLRFLAKNVLRLKPGYFRLNSDFDVHVTLGGRDATEKGSTLHEVVAFKPY